MMFKLIDNELHTLGECPQCKDEKGYKSWGCRICNETGEVYTKVYIPKPVIPAGTVSNRTWSDIKLHNHYNQQLSYKAEIEDALRVEKPRNYYPPKRGSRTLANASTLKKSHKYRTWTRAQTLKNQFSINNGDIIKE